MPDRACSSSPVAAGLSAHAGSQAAVDPQPDQQDRERRTRPSARLAQYAHVPSVPRFKVALTPGGRASIRGPRVECPQNGLEGRRSGQKRYVGRCDCTRVLDDHDASATPAQIARFGSPDRSGEVAEECALRRRIRRNESWPASLWCTRSRSTGLVSVSALRALGRPQSTSRPPHAPRRTLARILDGSGPSSSPGAARGGGTRCKCAVTEWRELDRPRRGTYDDGGSERRIAHLTAQRATTTGPWRAESGRALRDRARLRNAAPAFPAGRHRA